WLSWPTFSSMVICASRSSTLRSKPLLLRCEGFETFTLAGTGKLKNPITTARHNAIFVFISVLLDLSFHHKAQVAGKTDSVFVFVLQVLKSSIPTPGTANWTHNNGGDSR